MAIPPRTVITGTAIPRLDAGATGIHLVWSGPELTPLAAKGYEIRRRSHLTLKTTRICAVFDAARLATLAGTLWVPETPSPHATWVYSWIRPPSRSRRRTRTLLRRAGGCSRPDGGLWRSVRCGRWTL